MTIVSAPAPAAFDPRLQWLLERASYGILPEPTASTSLGEIAVIAKVRNLERWTALSEVRPGAYLGYDQDPEGHMVTARIPLVRAEYVRGQPFVVSLELARPLRLALDATMVDVEARPQDLQAAGASVQDGRDVVIGIIDLGCDFAHENFRKADGSTRLLAIWDQSGATILSSPYGYGRVYSSAEIDAALAQPDPYAALGYGPEADLPGQNPGTHGTHVMDIAAGNGRGSKISGVAPSADLIFVNVDVRDVFSHDAQLAGSSLGDSVNLAEALDFIFNMAAERPCVINVSLGTNGGAHDGTSNVERGIDALISAKPNRAVVLAAGNAYAHDIHASGTVQENSSIDVLWDIPHNDPTLNECEIWYSGTDEYLVEVFDPDGAQVARLALGDKTTGINKQGQTFFLATHGYDHLKNGDIEIGIFVEAHAAGGTWTIRLQGVQVTNGTFHAWIERDDVRPSRFRNLLDKSCTLGSLSCGQHSIVVGSYDAHKTALPISWFSSAGPTRDGRQKPEISAPGHDVFAAHSRTKTGIVRKRGTSMAAPAVTGVIALMLAEARAGGHDLTIVQIRDLICNTARSVTASAWDSRHGFGRISAAAVVREVLQLL